jgi:SulP family sulfate permease
MRRVKQYPSRCWDVLILAVSLVAALIFVLGIDLTIEAVWDTRNRVNRSEYITIWAIAIGMTV